MGGAEGCAGGCGVEWGGQKDVTARRSTVLQRGVWEIYPDLYSVGSTRLGSAASVDGIR